MDNSIFLKVFLPIIIKMNAQEKSNVWVKNLHYDFIIIHKWYGYIFTFIFIGPDIWEKIQVLKLLNVIFFSFPLEIIDLHISI